MRIFVVVLLTLFFAACNNQSDPPAIATIPHSEAKKLFLPKDTENPGLENKAVPLKTLNLVLGESNTIFYYGDEIKQIKKTDFKGIREILLQKKKEIGDSLVVLIKPGAAATYKNTVDVLDEMFVNQIEKYALVDLSKEEADYFGAKHTNAEEVPKERKRKK